MKYLLIDFGASHIKSISYDTILNKFSEKRIIDSPFKNRDYLCKKDLQKILLDITLFYSDIQKIYICTILGGFYNENIYYSWKHDQKNKNYCLISGLFLNEPTFHIHYHHKEYTDIKKYKKNISILGYINNIPIHSSLGDTNCVMESLALDNTNIAVNIGTGSQLLYIRDNKIHIERYFPAGRMLLVYNKLFSSLGFDIFNFLKTIDTDSVVEANLSIDLNVFKQSRNFIDGGKICNIQEENFNINNLLGSILKTMILQYKNIIQSSNSDQLFLCGGMFNHIPCLEPCFKIFYPKLDVILKEDNVESTFKGMVKLIS